MTGASMDKVVVNIETEGMTRASEIISDLRNATESIYYPMKIVGRLRTPTPVTRARVQ